MELRDLEYFLALAQEGNITRAAQRLHLTQPTLSRQLADLEEELGTRLFQRGHKAVILTQSGQLLLQRARELTALMAKTRRDLQESKQELSGSIAIGCVETKASEWLADALGTFIQAHPGITVDLVSGNGDDLKIKLDEGLIDLAVLLEPIETAKYDALRLPIEETWGLILPVGHPLAAKAGLTSEDLKGLPLSLSRRPLIVDEVEGWLGIPDLRLKATLTHNLLTNSLLFAQRGIAYPISVEGALTLRPQAEFRFVPLIPHRSSGHVLAWKKNQIHNPPTRLFRQTVLEHISMPDTHG